ncbi:MAG: tannase/feruloyl esterase family alpha/beta hydrolase [Vicinamibacterales bacterium]
MTRRNRTLFLLMSLIVLTTGVSGQDQGGRGRGGVPPGAPVAGPGRGGPPAGPPPKALIPDARPVRTCESLAEIALPNTTIESAAVDANNPALCRVVAITTHPPAGDKVRIWVAIPLSNWNGRFMGNGGGGFSGGNAGAVNGPAAQGYAAGATDTGHEGGSGSFALDANGRLNWQLIRDNAHLGIHEMTVTGKALTQALYGVAPRYSYFNGCSTGGRQGLMEAQRYPQDYNGILSGAPAINWNRFHIQHLWGPVVMNAASNPVAPCKLAAATAAAIAACDTIDGVKDGVIEDPKRCTYDPQPLAGTSAGECGAFTDGDVTVIRKLWEGPRRQDGTFLWYGLPRGADLNALWTSRGTPLRPAPFGISMDWFRYFLTQDPKFDGNAVTPAGYERFWDQSVEQYGIVFGTDSPDLTAFRDRGGKVIVWHGWADQLITADGTVDYYTRVQQEMGGAKKTGEFIRLFMAPGVAHCGGGAGPAPANPIEALLAWVEEGNAPDMIAAIRRDQTGITRSRPLCAYPLVAKYRGNASTDQASNFTCSAGF